MLRAGFADYVVNAEALAYMRRRSLAGPVIARLADVTVLVSRRDHLHSPLIANAARALEQAQAAPVGIVITK